MDFLRKEEFDLTVGEVLEITFRAARVSRLREATAGMVPDLNVEYPS